MLCLRRWEFGADSTREAVGRARLAFWRDVQVERNRGGCAMDRHSAGTCVDAGPCSRRERCPWESTRSLPSQRWAQHDALGAWTAGHAGYLGRIEKGVT